MEIAIKNILNDKYRKDFQLNIPAQLLNQKINEYLAKIQPEFSMNGYEKGQVPLQTIKEKYGKTIMAEQSDLLISEAISQIVNDNKYKVASYPKIAFKSFEEGKDVNIIASFELFPAIPQIELSKISMNKYQVEVSEDDLDEMADKFIKSKLNWQKQDSIYLSNFGDIVVINYHGNINGNSFEGGDGENYRLELGSQTFIDNFEEQLVGKISGQKVQVHVTFPSDYFRPQLSNQKAVFDVEILEILKADHPVLDSAFIKEVTGYEDIEDLKDALYDQAIFSYDATCRAIFKKELFDYLDSAYNIELPVGLVNEQTNFLKNIPGQQNPVKNDDSVEGRLKNLKLSQRMVRCGLILAEIANLNNISVSKEDVDNEIENIVNLYPEQKDEVLKMYNTNKQAVQQLQGAILEEKTVNFILSNINTVTIPVTTKQVDRLWFDITNNN